MRAKKRIPRRRKKLLLAGLLVLVCAGFGTSILLVRQSESKPPSVVKQAAVPKPVADTGAHTIRFIATGDMLPHASVNQNARQTDGSYNYRPFFSHLQPYLTSADMAYCNQESPSNPSANISGYPTFNAPATFAQNLNQEGCNVINLANNHADDNGQTGINATLEVWSGLKTLAVAGTNSSQQQQSQVVTFTVKGVRFAFLSYAQCSNDKSVNSYGLNIFSTTLADQQIAAARAQQADMIIAAMHSCDENRSTEDSWQDQTVQYFASKGVDIVVGTGPHWLQPAQRLPRSGGGTTVVWYSLGNLLSTQLDINGLIGGIASMTIDTKTKTVTSLSFMPTYMHYEWTAAQKATDDEAARHNLLLYPLDQAATPLANSQDNTTVAEQTARVTQLMNSYTPVTMLTSSTFLR